MPMETITEDSELKTAGFYWRNVEGVQALICAPLEQDGFVNGFSTRGGGVSPMPQDALNLAGFNEDTAENILENRSRFLKLFEGEWSLAGCWQVHGADVRVVKEPSQAQRRPYATGDDDRCDALVSDLPRALLGVKTADCVPMLMGDRRTGAFAAVHAGWRGTLASIGIHAIEQLMKNYQVRPEDLRVAIGPAAGACCYEVGSDVIDAFKAKFADAGDWFTATRDGHALVDLYKANQRQLISRGVIAERIYTSPLCTMCRTDLFFSYRREKSLHGKVGRLMAVIGRLPL
ncbi:MAG TPA: peptidoglycan editing factor PgeF [Pyrinomonadaceae bacterium]|nr:peptidoglycan editing factor PgeF [Pyrinomonadaceae bacterium]